MERVPEQRVVTANMARAAAAMGDRLKFAELWHETWRLVDEHDDTEEVAFALGTLAEGAAMLGDPDRGQLAAVHALKVATQRNEAEHRLVAERVLESLRTVRVGVVVKPQPRTGEPPDAELDFAGHLVAALNGDFVAGPAE
jgi:hypothetical protein